MDFIQPNLLPSDSKKLLNELGLESPINSTFTEVQELPRATKEEVLLSIDRARIWLEKQPGGGLAPQTNFPGWKILFRDDEVREAFREHSRELLTLYIFCMRDKETGTVVRMGGIEKYLKWFAFNGLLALPMVDGILYPWSIDDILYSGSIDDDVNAQAWSLMITSVNT